MTISDAMETTIAEGIRAGIIDPKLHAGPSECIRALAKRADWQTENDNVTMPTLLKYLASLNLVEAAKPGRPRAQKDAKKPASKLDAARTRRLNVV